MGASRGNGGRGAAGAAAMGAMLLCAGGCATDYGIRRGPSLAEFGEGLLAIGAALGVGAGAHALAEAGGGEGAQHLFRPEHEWPDGW